MLAQHMITKPVFEALFDNYSFVRSNPVSKALQGMVNLLEEQALEKDTLVLSRFYESVKMRVSGIDNAEGRQRIIIELYDKFFRTAFPLTVEKLGIVYTPVEVVDFINRSVADVLQATFGRSLSDENVPCARSVHRHGDLHRTHDPKRTHQRGSLAAQIRL